MIREGKMICDACEAVITRVEGLPPEGWPKLHCLCSACFVAAWQKQG